MWQTYLQPTSLAEALALLHQHAGQCRIVELVAESKAVEARPNG